MKAECVKYISYQILKMRGYKMFKLTAIVNFLMIDDETTSIICKVFERLKIGDSFILGNC